MRSLKTSGKERTVTKNQKLSALTTIFPPSPFLTLQFQVTPLALRVVGSGHPLRFQMIMSQGWLQVDILLDDPLPPALLHHYNILDEAKEHILNPGACQSRSLVALHLVLLDYLT